MYRVWYRKKRGDYASYDQCIRAKIGLTGKSAKLKCSEFSTLENREIKMQQKNSVLQYTRQVSVWGFGFSFSLVSIRQMVINMSYQLLFCTNYLLIYSY